MDMTLRRLITLSLSTYLKKNKIIILKVLLPTLFLKHLVYVMYNLYPEMLLELGVLKCTLSCIRLPLQQIDATSMTLQVGQEKCCNVL